MHGAGNDYIYVDTTRYPIGNPEKLSKEWSALHTGIGSDGLVLIGRSGKADFSMRIFNADGSEAKMCGNASRCIGKYLYDYKLTSKTEITLDTLSGIKTLKLHVEDNKVDTVTVDMGIPACEPACYDGKEGKPMKEHPIEIDGVRYTGTTVSMGNPHLVIFVNDITKVDLPVIGPKMENHPFISRTHQCGVCPSIGRRKNKDAGMGTRFGHHTSLWNRGMRHRRSRFSHRTLRKKSNRHHGWRSAYH